MSRLMAMVANDPERVGCVLFPGRRQLVADDREMDGWGIGTYQGGEVLLQRHPRRLRDTVDFYALGAKLRTDVMVGHVRHATVGSVKLENTHPFRFRSWLLAHHGTIGNFGDIHDELVRCIPDFLRRNIRGQTDSEHFFHLFLSFLHDAGRLDDPLISPRVATDAFRQALAFVRRLNGNAPTEMDAVITNGRILLASRRGSPLHFYRLRGVGECPACRPTEDFGKGPKVHCHEHLQAVVLVAQPAATTDAPWPAPWEELADGQLLVVHHDLSIEASPLERLA